MTITLYVGERNYSSWSLRPWLVLKWSGLAFEDRLISLDQPGYGDAAIAEIRGVSPSGRVPALDANGLTVWDSLAIAEWAAENAPAAVLWPRDAAKRAQARAVTAEMHAGFAALRRDLPMNIRRRCAPQNWNKETHSDIARIDEVWETFRLQNQAEGPYLFGTRSIADAFFTPVATRMRTYAVTLSAAAQAYAETLLADDAFRTWEQRALAEWKAPFARAPIDAMYA